MYSGTSSLKGDLKGNVFRRTHLFSSVGGAKRAGKEGWGSLRWGSGGGLVWG